jgi:hypothetical protein
LISSVPISEKLFIGRDLNGHVDSTRVGFNGVHGGFRYGSRKQEREGILNYALDYDLIVFFLEQSKQACLSSLLVRLKSIWLQC